MFQRQSNHEFPVVHFVAQSVRRLYYPAISRKIILFSVFPKYNFCLLWFSPNICNLKFAAALCDDFVLYLGHVQNSFCVFFFKNLYMDLTLPSFCYSSLYNSSFFCFLFSSSSSYFFYQSFCVMFRWMKFDFLSCVFLNFCLLLSTYLLSSCYHLQIAG